MIKTVKTKNYGIAEIIGEGNKYGYLEVKFLNTNHVDEFRKDAVCRGEIRDKYAVTYLGVGIIGNIKTRGIYKKPYTTWRNMLNRCYGEKNSAYSNVTVCDRWKTFELFYKDMPTIDGWNEQLYREQKLVLDKDSKQEFCKKKVYSPQTCSWLSPTQNNKLQDGQQRKFKAISPSGETFYDRNITSFAREHGLERKQVSAVLHKRFKSTLGWKFEFVDKEIV